MLSNKNSDCMWIQMSTVLQHSPRSRCLQTRCSICAPIKANKIDSDRSSLVLERLHFIGCWAAESGMSRGDFLMSKTMKQWTRLVEFKLTKTGYQKANKDSEILRHGRALKCEKMDVIEAEAVSDLTPVSNGRLKQRLSIMWRMWRDLKIFKIVNASKIRKMSKSVLNFMS